MQGELDNRNPGQVKGWLRFFRRGQQPLPVLVDLDGDFHDDIRGSLIRLTNPKAGERNSEGATYMEGFDQVQSGTVGDMTAGISLGPWTEAISRKLMDANEHLWGHLGLRGAALTAHRKKCLQRYRDHIAAGDLYFPYVNYPYFEWYSSNGRVVLELKPQQVTVVERAASLPERTGIELLTAKNRRDQAFSEFLEDCASGEPCGPGEEGSGEDFSILRLD